MKTNLRFTLLPAILLLTACSGKGDWKRKLDSELQRFGHRNWIVVADYAYPSQSAPGIKTIYTGEKHLEVLDHVLNTINQVPHVRPVLLVDRELEMLPENLAPGIGEFRTELDSMLQGRSRSSLPHMDIIARLDSSSALFEVMILKTSMTLPYTSVFIELDCGYWDSEKESRFRESAEQ
jgi:hypothetical protein